MPKSSKISRRWPASLPSRSRTDRTAPPAVTTDRLASRREGGAKFASHIKAKVEEKRLTKGSGGRGPVPASDRTEPNPGLRANSGKSGGFAPNWPGNRGLWTLLLSLILGVIATGLIVWTTDVKERYWDADRARSNERIHDLDVVVANANARAAEADLARAKIEARLAPRRLNEQQQESLAGKMAAFSQIGDAGKQLVAVFPFPVAFDNGALADNIAAALGKAGWSVNRYPVTYGAGIGAVLGVGILTSSNPRSVSVATALAAALQDEGIAAGVLDVKRSGCEEMGYSQEKIDAEPWCSAISVFVGDHP